MSEGQSYVFMCIVLWLDKLSKRTGREMIVGHLLLFAPAHATPGALTSLTSPYCMYMYMHM